MNERREPTISTYAPPKDEAVRSQAPSGVKARPVPQAPPSAAHSPAAKPIVVKSTLAPFAFVFALLAGCAAGLIYWQLMETQKLLAASNARIADLESKFALSDDESTASAATMQAKLKWADSEIRKLWGVSYDTNRKAIATNKANLAAVRKTANETKDSVDGKIKSATKGLTADLSLVSDLVDAQQASMTSIEKQNLQIKRNAQSLTDKINSLEASKKEQERRIKSNEQAVEAIDAFRRSVNAQLIQLRGGAPGP